MNTLLIANRGEIACRIIHTAHKLGIKTIAIYSPQDRNALHVSKATYAVSLGDDVSPLSYLDIERILTIAKNYDVDAIHPGYGFLSENASFVQACERANITFIGPSSYAMSIMANKSKAKMLAIDIGVPQIEGYSGDSQNDEVLYNEALKIGFPVLIKAVLGGGGRGMRIVEDKSQLLDAIQSAKRETSKAFGDNRLLLEPFLSNARHIEVQILADKHGHVLYFGDRDCSTQRRYQKIIEEAPAPNIKDEIRVAMGECAVKLARKIGYESAGTVEFLLNGDDFYFMEMNTRLQVEHPITEKIFDIDFVEWQLRIADGEALPYQQHDIKSQGHAIEIRLCAEDPYQNFRPTTGKITQLCYPSPNHHLRIDTGIKAQDTISSHYDSLLAKIIVWHKNRQLSLSYLSEIMKYIKVDGIETNLPVLIDVILSDNFIHTKINTSWFDEWLLKWKIQLKQKEDKQYPLWFACIMAVWIYSKADSQNPWQALSTWRLNASKYLSMYISDNIIHEDIKCVECKNHEYQLLWRNNKYDFKYIAHSVDEIIMEWNNERIAANYYINDNSIMLYVDGHKKQFSMGYISNVSSVHEDEKKQLILSPITGKIVSCNTNIGEKINKGDILVIVEAMKMEYSVSAPYTGKIKTCNVKVGDIVEQDFQLMILEKDEKNA